MHYYIDGYNLLFRLSRAGDELQKQRQGIIQDLETKINFIGLDATLVFDAQHYEGDSIRRHLNRLEVVFTAAGETADEYILQRLKESPNPSQETVATSDKKLAWLSRSRHAYTQSVEDFVAWLNKRYRNKLREKSSKKPLALRPLKPHQSASSHNVRVEVAEPSSRPLLNATVEECFVWYLKAFEEAFKETVNDPELPPESITPLFSIPALGVKSKKKLRRYENPLVSDMERWLKVFERPLDEDIP
jgi:predicted RNA-binding protein with PIN domain